MLRPQSLPVHTTEKVNNREIIGTHSGVFRQKKRVRILTQIKLEQKPEKMAYKHIIGKNKHGYNRAPTNG